MSEQKGTTGEIKTAYRIDWLVPERNAVIFPEQWSAAGEYDNEDTALYWLDWYKKQTPDDKYRLVVITETVVQVTGGAE